VNQMRILVVADVSAEFVYGGAERMLHHHIRGLVQAGHDVTVLTRQPDITAELQVALIALGITEYRLPFSGDKGYQGLRQLKQEAKLWWIKHHQLFDMVVSEQPFVMWALLKAGCDLPRLQVCHSFAFEEYQTRHALNPSFKHHLAIWMMKKLENEVYNSANKLLVLSQFMQARLKTFFAVAEAKSVVVPGAAEIKEVISEQDRLQFRKELDWETPVITTLRNLVPRTGVDLMIQAAAILKAKKVDARWVIMGDGILKESMVNMAKELAVDDIISFTGFLPEEDVQKSLVASDVFMVPTRGLEGFGLVTLEANVCGTPVLATPIAANAELVPTIAHNQLADTASPSALADKLIWMLEHPISEEERHGLQRDSEALYSWKKHDQVFIEIVASLVTGKS
ncbi:MAG: glycosyltransferase family 4 protein, partial [Ghiorsea sp.]